MEKKKNIITKIINICQKAMCGDAREHASLYCKVHKPLEVHKPPIDETVLNKIREEVHKKKEK